MSRDLEKEYQNHFIPIWGTDIDFSETTTEISFLFSYTFPFGVAKFPRLFPRYISYFCKFRDVWNIYDRIYTFDLFRIYTSQLSTLICVHVHPNTSGQSRLLSSFTLDPIGFSREGDCNLSYSWLYVW